MIDVAQVTDKLQRLKSRKAEAALAAAEKAAARGSDELWIVDPKTGRPQAVPASQLRERVCSSRRNSTFSGPAALEMRPAWQG